MPHPLRYRVFYTTRQKIVTSALVLALLACGTVYAVKRLTTPEDRSCAPGVARPVGSEECVGVSGDGFDFRVGELTDVARAIARENGKLTAGEYATVALLLPLTSTSPGLRTKVLHEVQGAFAQQYEANNRSNSQVPKIRLVLANTGNGNAHWRTTVADLKAMTGAPHHLRAVSGIATSSTPVRQAVTELTRAGIAVVGTTITADDLANGPGRTPFPGLARVSPTNSDEAKALAHFGRVDAAKAVLVHDARAGDHYTDTLKNAFSTLLASSPYQPHLFTSPKDPTDEGTTANTFRQIALLLCTTRADTVFFAGRHTQLRQFINALGARGCTHRAFTVLTGDEGSYLGADGRLDRRVLGAGLTVRYAALAHPDAWRAAPGRTVPKTGGSPAAYGRFLSMMNTIASREVGPVGRSELSDGQSIIGYDAMATAVHAIRQATVQGERLPAPEDVGLQWPQVTGSLRVEGASGWICLDNHGNPYNKAVPVVELTRGEPRFVQIAWPEGKPPTGECLPPRKP
ncbi:ABC transporter substrate-binding protein [Streptomyces ficellus]|uniref:ABC transporter substrate-binding protein n=1 Tax=Streptomyces ficellus TaxID=1977088 RepID=A0ABT7Z7W8_9ACTN|nr:ABC transporter substrate-binding protein [Streptomyces ficellus]MDN3295589.1 ABC transporter substrate-binding protein [Streptomyces ficellus]